MMVPLALLNGRGAENWVKTEVVFYHSTVSGDVLVGIAAPGSLGARGELVANRIFTHIYES